MKTDSFEFRLPNRLVPTAPAAGSRRDHARMVVLDRQTATVEHRRFDDLGDYLRGGDVLVVNDSLVMQDELRGESRSGPMRVILCGFHRDGWYVLAKPATRAKRGVVVRVGDGAIRVTLRKPGLGTDMWLARLEHEGSLPELLERHGIRYSADHRPPGDRRQSYQNVYARNPGSLEIPSAGLHFTSELLSRLQKDRCISVVPITLHVGLTELSTYRHIDTENVEEHRVAAEWYEISRAAARTINGARRRGGRIVAVGTTVVRALETATETTGSSTKLKPGQDWTEFYIHPGYQFRIVDMMLTNLHQPRSSHLVLVAAFAGADFVMQAYREIVRARYHFDVFGDSMLIR
jgi:S-adenosylmethionine:tRNA ribosyltransferase-isomerase